VSERTLKECGSDGWEATARMYAAELDRARCVEQEQAAAIKALADALLDNMPPERRAECWCPWSRDVDGAGHQPPCAKAREALRLVGRLP
jgi:hypothetical protein